MGRTPRLLCAVYFLANYAWVVDCSGGYDEESTGRRMSRYKSRFCASASAGESRHHYPRITRDMVVRLDDYVGLMWRIVFHVPCRRCGQIAVVTIRPDLRLAMIREVGE